MAKKKFSEKFKDFSLDTTCHGLAQIYKHKLLLVAVIWIVIVVVVFTQLIWQIIDRFIVYFDYGTSLQVSLTEFPNLTLPAVTICNANRYFSLTPREQQALNTLSYIYDLGESPNKEQMDLALQFFDGQGPDFNLTNYLWSKTWHLTKDTVFFCQVNGPHNCTSSQFRPVFLSELGLCWTFEAEAKQYKRGINQGFHIGVNVLQMNYSEDLFYGRSSAGIVFQVHALDVPTQVQYVGSIIGVGSWANVVLQKVAITNMYQPWGLCKVHHKVLKYHPAYSSYACFQECTDQHIVDTCLCRDPPTVGFFNVRECSAAEVLQCAAPQRCDFERKTTYKDCNCYEACKEIIYETEISYTTFPSQAAAIKYQTIQNNSYEYFRENFVGMSLFYGDLFVKNENQVQALSSSALLSDIGGQMGLWLGVSVITLLEFLQFFIGVWGGNKTAEKTEG